VGGLLGYQLVCGRLLERFARQQNHRSHVWYRWFNEIPALGLFVILALVITKPF
jgi:putative membrane protein